MNLRTTLIVFLCFCATTVLRAERVDMLKAGAKANGKTLNTKLINSTIDRLNRGGGGTLFFPAGTYLTGSIHLKSNITLELEAGATLLFSDNFDDYLPFVEVRHEGVMMKSFQPLIYAVDAENITIKGEGTLDGQGKKWWMEFFRVMIDLKDNGMRDVNKYQPMWDAANDTTAIYAETNKDYVNTLQRRFFRPPFIQPVRCKKVKIEGVKIINSPFWTVNPEFCDNVTIKGITIDNAPSPNTDGVNPESCRNALRYMGAHSGRDGDKAAAAGLTPAAMGNSVTYEEANLTFLCKKLYQHQFAKENIAPEIQQYYASAPKAFPDFNGGWQPHIMFIGEIIDVDDKR